jgi:predicted polyphosphate/ATP-dependent NAD kinase
VVNTVGVIVNPIAGKDIRRLATAASHTSDSSKIETVRRGIIAAVEAGAGRVIVSADPHRLAERAVHGLHLPVDVLDIELRRDRSDTTDAAAAMWKAGVDVVLVLGGDGTCRDVAKGWPDATLIPISTGTNNVYPISIDATSAGTAAGFVATGAVDPDLVVRRSKKVNVIVEDRGSVIHDLALVDLAFIDAQFVGARAVLDPASVRLVAAAIATPMSTGLSSIVGRLLPVDRWHPGGAIVRLGDATRRVRAPLSPGAFSTFGVTEARRLDDGEPVTFHGPGILAFDGERDMRISAESTVTVSIDSVGPFIIDVGRTLSAAAALHLFETSTTSIPEEHHGD